jgi:PAS domain S-box-containing protein
MVAAAAHPFVLQPGGELVPKAKTSSGNLISPLSPNRFPDLRQEAGCPMRPPIAAKKSPCCTLHRHRTVAGHSARPMVFGAFHGHQNNRRYRDDNRRLKNALEEISLASEEMQISNAQYFGLAACTADHIFVLDLDGAYTYSNDRVKQFGLKIGSELIGRRIQDVYHGDLLCLYRDKIKEVRTLGEAVSFHHQKATPRGEEYHIDTLYPIRYHGSVRAIGGICRNISEQKSIETQLFQSQKMEALGTLVAGVAHEINNPINLILFNLPLFEKMWQDLMPVLESHLLAAPQEKIGGLLPSFVKENLPRLISDMEMAAKRVARIVSGLKGFSRKSNPAEKWNLDVNKAVRNAVRLAKATITKSRTTMEVDLAPDMPLLHANLQNLEQIVLNLIINAMESIDHDHGKVWIETRYSETDKHIAIEVGDNGRGVSPKVAEKIFDPFVTDRQAFGGTGLGLSVTYNLVKAHDGDITFKTLPGQGTTFHIALPIGARQKPHQIMVVDDDDDFREMILRAMARNENCVVEDYANGAEALIRMGSHPPDLLVLDMFMPEMDGLGVCRAIKNELGLDLMKVIIVTGFPDHPNLYEATRMGFGQILTKPLVMDEFIRIVQDSLNAKSIE